MAGGGKALALPRPVHGRDKVVRLLRNIKRTGIRLGLTSMHPAEVNGQPGALFLDSGGRPVLVVSLDIADGLVQTVRAVSSPDKLRHLHSLPSAR